MNNNFITFSKNNRFDDLKESIKFCNICSRLCERTKVFSSANGNLDSKVLFIAEAPGRFGADKTGVPLCGDRTGDNFENLLSNIGWQREQIFITNAVLCNPREQNGKNATPTSEEIFNCSFYLDMVITLIKPDIIVTLGATALKALEIISPHGLKLKDKVASIVTWHGLNIFPLYHPGPRALVHRSLAKQRSDFMRLSKIIHPLKGFLVRKRRKLTQQSLFKGGYSPLQQIARTIVEICGRVTYFKLVKMIYLIDIQSLKKFGSTVGSDLYIRQVDGPWPPKLADELRAMNGFEINMNNVGKIQMVSIGPSPRSKIRLNDEILEVIEEITSKCKIMNNSKVKTLVYLTDPMRFILKEEKKGKDMRNKVVLYKNKTIADNL